MATPETKQVGSADSAEVLSYKQDYYGKPPENPLQCSGTPSLPGAGLPPLDEYQGTGWGLGDDANLCLCLSPSMQSEGDWSVHAMNPGPGKCPCPTVQTRDLGNRSHPEPKEFSLSKYFRKPPQRTIKTFYPLLRDTMGLWSSLQITFRKVLLASSLTMSPALINFLGTVGLQPTALLGTVDAVWKPDSQI